jgi:hypothetical protein
MRAGIFAATAWLGMGLSCVAFADTSGVATGGSAGATSTLPGPASQPGTGETPADELNLRRGAVAGGSAGISEKQVRQSLEAAGYTDVDIKRDGDDWVARGMLNGATQRLRIDSKTGQAKQ